MSYAPQPTSPSSNFFALASPTAFSFAAQQSSPRDAYNMYADLRSLSSASHTARGHHGHSGQGLSLRKKFWK
ncbi:hypothetical protein PNOK_0277200 [Pyrrhoderma noxium]|uniref:Uncharacterized protein n=1 Tax=Pyrrhoderma noxium TaxID=2282107 RepID=A0A286UTM1_9AGAM|nr:hypothetical protein PNOK_0277200 [Pyrrhoderma noxium]